MFGLVPIVLVVGVVAGYVLWWEPSHPPSARSSDGDPALSGPPAPAHVVPGRDYYLFVKTIELYPKQPDGGTWDRLDGSAPDITYSLVWQGHTVYTSPTRDNVLIGLWNPISIDIAEALPMLGTGKLDLASTLNQGAIINITPNGTLKINVWDKDAPGLGSEGAGQVVLRVDELLQGDNIYTFEASKTNAIKRLVLGTTDTSQPLKNLVEALSNP